MHITSGDKKGQSATCTKGGSFFGDQKPQAFQSRSMVNDSVAPSDRKIIQKLQIHVNSKEFVFRMFYMDLHGFVLFSCVINIYKQYAFDGLKTSQKPSQAVQTSRLCA